MARCEYFVLRQCESMCVRSISVCQLSSNIFTNENIPVWTGSCGCNDSGFVSAKFRRFSGKVSVLTKYWLCNLERSESSINNWECEDVGNTAVVQTKESIYSATPWANGIRLQPLPILFLIFRFFTEVVNTTHINSSSISKIVVVQRPGAAADLWFTQRLVVALVMLEVSQTHSSEAKLNRF